MSNNIMLVDRSLFLLTKLKILLSHVCPLESSSLALASSPESAVKSPSQASGPHHTTSYWPAGPWYGMVSGIVWYALPPPTTISNSNPIPKVWASNPSFESCVEGKS